MPARRSITQQTTKTSKASKIPPALQSARGVKTWKEAADWLKIRGIEDIELSLIHI